MTEYKLCREHIKDIGLVSEYLELKATIRVTPGGYVRGLPGCQLCAAEGERQL